jgi:hypothetical protein
VWHKHSRTSQSWQSPNPNLISFCGQLTFDWLSGHQISYFRTNHTELSLPRACVLAVSFLVGYLTTMWVSRLYILDDRLINEYGAIGGMGIGGQREVLGEKPLQCHFFHHKSYVTWDRTQVAKVGRRRLAAWALAQPPAYVTPILKLSELLSRYKYRTRNRQTPGSSLGKIPSLLEQNILL